MKGESLVYAILVPVLGGWIYGYNTGIIAGVGAPIVQSKFFPDNSATSQSSYLGVLTASILVGAFIGTFTGGRMATVLGRKKAVFFCGAVCAVFASLMAAYTNYWFLVVCRFFLGISVGVTSAVCPLYVGEVAPKDSRGRLGVVIQISICATILVAQAVNYVFNLDSSESLPDWNWKLQFALGAIPGLGLLVVSLFMPESQTWLDSQHEARQAKGGFGGSASGGSDRDNLIEGGVSPARRAGSVQGAGTDSIPLCSKTGLYWIAIGTILAASQQLTGINAVIFYAPTIFQDAGFKNILLMTLILVGGWNLLSVFISFALVDRLGRRVLLLSALGVMALGLGLIGLAYAAFPDYKSTACIIAILLFIGAFEVGPGPLFFVVCSETFPASIRDSALSASVAISWIFNLIVSFGFPVLKDAAGSAATFFFFCGASVVCFCLILCLVRETKGVTVGAVDPEADSLLDKANN